MDRRFDLSANFPPHSGFAFTPAVQPESSASQGDIPSVTMPQVGFSQNTYSQSDSAQFSGSQFSYPVARRHSSHLGIHRRMSPHHVEHFHPYARRAANQHHVRNPAQFTIQDPNQYAVQDPSQYIVHNGFSDYQFSLGFQQHPEHLMAQQHSLSNPKTESKPRLSKEEVEKLEKVFQENAKPSSSAKGQLADSLGLDRPRVNNWFQNRRAKAKQERKQEEYEAQRAAEKAGSEPTSAGSGSSGTSPEPASESVRRHAQPSSAVFPGLDSTLETVDASSGDCSDDDSVAADDDDNDDVSPTTLDHSSSYEEEAPDHLHSPLAINLSPPEAADFGYSQFQPDYPHLADDVANTFMSLPVHTKHVNEVSPDEQPINTAYSSSTVTPFVQSQSTFPTPVSNGDMEGFLSNMSNCSENGSTPVSEGLPTPNGTVRSDSFKSPPPPTNIAYRRNIARPANLKTTGFRSRSYNLPHGPKTMLDGPMRVNPSSPGLSMRRVASNTGSYQGRIQKPISGPRPTRNPEALLPWYGGSSAGSMAAAFPGAAPPTPLTPVIVSQSSIVSPTCSDGSPFQPGKSLPATTLAASKADPNLKTPPTTPGLLTPYGNQNYTVNSFDTGANFHSDQPVWTPFDTEFSGFSMSAAPTYTEASDASLPTTPIYPNAAGTGFVRPLSAGTMSKMIVNTQFDWDANESVNSSKSSPNMARSKQIQFTQNMTPQDYNSHQDK